MAICKCKNSTHYRITGEVWDKTGANPTKKDCEDSKYAHIRCAECDGKVGIIGAKILEKFGVPREEVHNGRCLEEPVEITIDLI